MQHGRHLYISVLDIVVLLYNVYRASKNSIGYNDADKTLAQLTSELKGHMKVRVDTLEKLLYASNMLDEQKKFWHYRDTTFDSFLKRVAPKLKFDKKRNYFE